MLSLFLSQAAAGSLLVLMLVPAPAAGRKFFRLTVGQSGALLILALVLSREDASPTLRGAAFIAGALLLMIAAGLFHVGRLGAGKAVMTAALLPVLAGIGIDALALIPPQAGGWARLLYPLDALTSGLVTGSVLIAMILGHYYLNVPGLAIAHLQRLSLVFLTAVALRLVVTATSLAIHRGAVGPLVAVLLDTAPGALPAGTDPLLLVFVLIHLLFGILAPALFALMAWRTARIASTQSATGILYVALVMAIMGELSSRYLLALTRLPL